MSQFGTQGRKEVAEATVQAVLIASLSALCTGLINWQIERLKKKSEPVKPDEKKGESK